MCVCVCVCVFSHVQSCGDFSSLCSQNPFHQLPIKQQANQSSELTFHLCVCVVLWCVCSAEESPCGGVVLSCTEKLNRRTVLLRPLSKQEPYSHFSFFPPVRAAASVCTQTLLLQTSDSGCQQHCASSAFISAVHSQSEQF